MRCNGYVFLSLFALFAASAQAETAKLQDSPEAARAYPMAKREAQLQAVSAMPQVDVQYGAFGRIRRVEGRSALFLPSVARLKKGDKATELLQRVKGLLMANGSEALIVQESGRPPAGGGYYAFTQQMIGTTRKARVRCSMTGIPIDTSRIRPIPPIRTRPSSGMPYT